MKSLRFMLLLAVPLALLACSPPCALAQSPAQTSFGQIKSFTTGPAAASHRGAVAA